MKVVNKVSGTSNSKTVVLSCADSDDIDWQYFLSDNLGKLVFCDISLAQIVYV